jgi:succinoglycan biosynthesis transport protein ExoP
VRVNRTDGSHDFFVTQAAQLHDKVTGLELELRDKKTEWGIASLEDQRALMLGRISNLRTSLMQTEATLQAANAEAEAHRKMLETIPAEIKAAEVSHMPNSAVSSMREQLFTAQVREKEILSRFTKEHPQAIAVAQQIAALEEVIKNEPLTPQVALEPNDNHQEISLALLKGSSSAASLEAHAKAVRQQLQEAEKELADFNHKEAEFSRLERALEIETANYKRYAESVEQARIDRELMMSNISNLNVLQEPTLSVTPTSPRRKMNLAVGFIVALASSAGVGLLLEQRRTGFLFNLASIPDAPPAPAQPQGGSEIRE